MNLGLRDAISLGPALARHIVNSQQADTADVDLEKWADERHAQALKVIARAKSMLAWAGAKNVPSVYYGVVPVNWFKVRNFILWAGSVTGFLKANLPWQLSGLLNP